MGCVPAAPGAPIRTKEVEITAWPLSSSRTGPPEQVDAELPKLGGQACRAALPVLEGEQYRLDRVAIAGHELAAREAARHPGEDS
jgi:hypothetical protein